MNRRNTYKEETMWYIQNHHIRSFSDFQARLFRRTTANMISVYRIIMALLLPFIFYGGWRTFGAAVFIAAVYLDFIDGAVARYQTDAGGFKTPPEDEASLSFISRLRLKGCTETGKWLDPFADKVLIQATLLSIGWSVVSHELLVASLILAICLTLARPLKKWMMKKGWRKSADGRANIFGKLKMWLEVGTIAGLFNTAENLLETLLQLLVSEVLLACALTSALLSLIFHLLPARKNK